jgi:hypothetical protein
MQAPRWIKITTFGIAVAFFITMIVMTSFYGSEIHGYREILRGINLSEILGGITVIGVFAYYFFSSGTNNQKYGITAVAIILGVWLANSGDLASLDWSEDTQARSVAQQRTQETFRNYIQFAFENLSDVKICTLDPSLPWYARQQPVIVPQLSDPAITSNFMALPNLMQDNLCGYLLWQHSGITGIPPSMEIVYDEGNITLIKYIAGVEEEIDELTVDDFNGNTINNWNPLSQNNVPGDYEVSGGLLSLSYPNNLTQRDTYAYSLNLTDPPREVIGVKMRVRISPGSRLTIDIVRNGELISPRFLNYYPGVGTGEWEEVVIPVRGKLNNITVGISEADQNSVTPNHHIDIDWIKVLITAKR